MAVETVSTGCHRRSCAHRLDEPLEKVTAVVGTRGRFGVILDREYRARHVREAFYGAVIEVTAGYPEFRGPLGESLVLGNRETVVLRGNLHHARIQIADGMIPPPVTVWQLEGAPFVEAPLLEQQLGGTRSDIVRTRIYLRDITNWELVARVHGERFETIRPANTLVEARLVGDEFLVEIEAEAVIGAGDAL